MNKSLERAVAAVIEDACIFTQDGVEESDVPHIVKVAVKAYLEDAPQVVITNCENYGGNCGLYYSDEFHGYCILGLGKPKSKDDYCMNIGPRCPGPGTCRVVKEPE